MTKVLVANVNSQMIEALKKGDHSLEFELEELNKHLSEGWEIRKYDIVNVSETLYSFSIVYILDK
jgi:hypothetical protein